MASPPRSPLASLARLRACSVQLFGLSSIAGAGVLGGGGGGSQAASAASAASAAANPSASASDGCPESLERTESCVVHTHEGVRLLRCTETLRRLRTCVGGAPQEVEVVESTTLRRAAGGAGGRGIGGGAGPAATEATGAAAAAAAAADATAGPPRGSVVLNPEATAALEEFMGYADHLAARSGGGGGGAQK